MLRGSPGWEFGGSLVQRLCQHKGSLVQGGRWHRESLVYGVRAPGRQSPVLRGSPEWDALSLEGPWCRECASTKGLWCRGVPGVGSSQWMGSGS